MARGKHTAAGVVAKAPLGIVLDRSQSCLLQARRIAFAATGRFNDAGCDTGINNGGLCGAAEHVDRGVEGFTHVTRQLVIERAVFGLDER
jgi:hypothetical protein